MKIRNLSPHDVVVIIGGKKINFPKEVEKFPRLIEEIKVIGKINNIPITKKVYGKCENLPEKVDDTLLIVSGLIATALPDRDDLIVPNTIRDEKGQIIGCDSFSIVADVKNFEIL